MSCRISEILEVINYVQNRFTPAMSNDEIGKLRKEAVRSVATDRGIEPSTVSDQYRRNIKPDIFRTSNFDADLQDWLRTGDKRLQSALLNHAESKNDEQAIHELFDSR